MKNNTAFNVVDEIIADLSDRGGLGDAWGECDFEIREEIRERWAALVILYGRD